MKNNTDRVKRHEHEAASDEPTEVADPMDRLRSTKGDCNNESNTVREREIVRESETVRDSVCDIQRESEMRERHRQSDMTEREPHDRARERDSDMKNSTDKATSQNRAT